ncbi:PepSY domain-containing protein [Xanthomarina sp. F2636L]|uniref:PepSY domain-containing protein n=1 Tax=Xanthomarina sp. F2636L TaxID=2996018 RepID=UPI00225DFAA5|nr:PepSY domain-containing protein [Xanthomarina sp. F2636L]MCX7551172.1 PepSY domain-containing protein [Xanthomarina sp. F2636L]
MTISIWRYSHLALAVSSFVFILLASVTGIILAFEPVSDKLQPYHVADLNTLSLAETVTVFKDNYPEVIELQVDANNFVFASVITKEGKSLNGYFNPETAQFLANKKEPSKFFQWVTNFHRSLFLKGTGRFFVGLCSFILFLIAVSGLVLVVKRQGSFKKIFSTVVNENFNQYWHVVLGRLSLIPIIIITLTGVYLSLEKFNVLPKVTTSHNIDFDAISETPKLDFFQFPVFKDIKLSQVKAVEFPFSEDVEDYFTIELKDREILVNQFTGTILSEEKYPLVSFFSNLSLNLHTGKGSIIWSIILAIASVNILFFIYSGFAMTLKRRKAKLKNKYKKDQAKYIILVGSENGSTIPFANALYKQLLQAGEKVYISELNKYTTYKKAKHLIVLTATYGQGEAPTNADKFLKLLKTTKQNKKLAFSVVGFGSLSYPDFCKYAFDVNIELNDYFKEELAPFTINDKSVEAFEKWTQLWAKTQSLEFNISKQDLVVKPKLLKKLKVVKRTEAKTNPDKTFLITLKPKKTYRFKSGDLLAIYPNHDYRERLYSIGKVNGNMQLSVKHFERGLGSNYLNNLELKTRFKARIVKNSQFYFPKKASQVVMIANGTGIGPFLGMLHENKKQIETYLYLGLRTQASFNLYQKQVEDFISDKKLRKLEVALSQEADKTYVQDALFKDAKFITKSLQNNGVIMICGSLAMQKGVLGVLEKICATYNNKPLGYYQNRQQLKMDCY